MFEKLKITWLWVLVTNYQIITWLSVLVTIYPKQSKDNARSNYPTNPNSEARLWNGKVLGTYSAPTEFGLLDSCDQSTLFMHAMNDMLYMWKKVNHTNLFMNASTSLFKKKNSDLFLFSKKKMFFFWDRKFRYVFLMRKFSLVEIQKNQNCFWKFFLKKKKVFDL